MNIRDPKFQQMVMFLVIMIVVLVLYFRFSYTPNKKKIARLNAKRDSLQIEVQKTEAARARLPELQAKIARLEQEWERAKEMLPKEKEIPSLIQQISNSGGKAGVSFSLFKPGNPFPKTDYTELPVELKVACGYHQLGRFLSNLGNLSRIVNVPSVRISTGGEKAIMAELSAVTYMVAKPKGVPSGIPPRR